MITEPIISRNPGQDPPGTVPMPIQLDLLQPLIRQALEALGIRNFLLSIQDPAFPSLPDEEIGRGSPCSQGALGFLQFAATLGFNGIQLGPQGITTPANRSPYDATLFSRNPLSLALLRLTRPPWNMLSPERLARLIGPRSLTGELVDENFARPAIERVATEAFAWFRRNCSPEKSDVGGEFYHAFSRFCHRNSDWLERDGLYEILRLHYGGRNWKDWGVGTFARIDKTLFALPPGGEESARARIDELRASHGMELEEYSFRQYLLHAQHEELRDYCRHLGLRLFCDCQIGLSGRDVWFAQPFLLPGYLMGAPPSRTNPEGQPWNYQILDPRRYVTVDADGRRRPGPALRFFRRRIDKFFEEFDGIRIDHPHGLICPWVYRSDRPDDFAAVQAGARLFASPALADHPELAQFAIPRPEQINPQALRYADDWVRELEPEQIRRYAERLEVIMASARVHCRGGCEIACEILSTQPYPVKKVMELYGLGRFLVTQKAAMDNPLDGYRSENGRPEDWLMLGNHDTPSLWQLAEKWVKDGSARQQAHCLADRLDIPMERREQWQSRVAADEGALAQAKFADLFVGPAQNVVVFFTDLLGMKERYNAPGTVSPKNWSLRISPAYRHQYDRGLRQNRVLNIPAALAMAMRAKGQPFQETYRELIRQLEAAGECAD